MRILTIAAVGAVALAACGQSVSMPAPVRGAWGADCSNPFVTFGENTIHFTAGNATYALTSVTFDGNNLNVAYTSPEGEVVETYVKSGETLRLDHGSRGGVPVAAQQHAMNRCP